jgi:hypothetical protein
MCRSHTDEDIAHLQKCTFQKWIWNRACSEKKLIRNPNEVILSACLFMQIWAGLFKGDMQDKVKTGVDVLMKTTLNIGGGSSLGNCEKGMISNRRTQAPKDSDKGQDSVA